MASAALSEPSAIMIAIASPVACAKPVRTAMPNPWRPVFRSSCTSRQLLAKSNTPRAVSSLDPSSTTRISNGMPPARSSCTSEASVSQMLPTSLRAGMTIENFIQAPQNAKPIVASPQKLLVCGCLANAGFERHDQELFPHDFPRSGHSQIQCEQRTRSRPPIHHGVWQKTGEDALDPKTADFQRLG